MATSSAMSTSNQYIKYTISVVTNKQDTTNNKSNVTVKVRVYRTNTGYTTYGSGTVYCKINGTTYSASITSDDKITNSGIELFSKTLDIAHNSDGTKTLTCSARIEHSQFSSSEQSYSVALTTIPRATTPTVNDSSVALGSAVTISTPRASSAFTHTLKYSIGSKSGTISTGVTTSYKWTIPLSLASALPSATSGKLTITCQTYNGSTLIGTKTITITVTVPSSVVPTISSITVTDSNTKTTALGVYVQNKSKLTIKISASGTYGSSIASYSTTFMGATHTVSSFTVSNITQSGDLVINATVKDSRGRTANLKKTITVHEYSTPVISSFNVSRCNEDMTLNEEGEYILVDLSYKISSLGSKNAKVVTIYYKKEIDDEYTSLISFTDSYEKEMQYKSTVQFDVNTSYAILVKISDSFTTASSETYLGTAFDLIHHHESGHGLGFGKRAEEEGVADFGLKAKFRENIEIYSDWIDLELSDSFVVYGGNASNKVMCHKVGNVVEIKGVIAPTEDIEGSASEVNIATGLPDNMLPNTARLFVCQGSYKMTWLLRVATDGSLHFSRYGGSDAYETATTAVWLPFNVVYTV